MPPGRPLDHAAQRLIDRLALLGVRSARPKERNNHQDREHTHESCKSCEPVAVPFVICRTSRHSKAAWLPSPARVASGQKSIRRLEIPIRWKALKVLAGAAAHALRRGANGEGTLKPGMLSDLKILRPR